MIEYGTQSGTLGDTSPVFPNIVPSGARSWALGFLWFIPFVGAVIAPVVLGFLAAQARRHPNPIVRENARWAANWVITVTGVVVVATILVVTNRVASYVIHGGAAETELAPLLLVANLLFWAAWISHLIVSIFGVSTGRTRVANPRIAVPFIPAV